MVPKKRGLVSEKYMIKQTMDRRPVHCFTETQNRSATRFKSLFLCMSLSQKRHALLGEMHQTVPISMKRV